MSEITSSYPFAAARIKVLETKLITRDKLNRVIDAKDFDAAMRVLQELGYGSSTSGTASFEQLIENELSETDALLLSISPSDVLTKILRLEKDYYNLKILIKSLMLGKNLDSITLSPGNIPVTTLRRAISENNYYELSEKMKEAMLYIDKQYSMVSDISIVGIALDRAFAKELTLLVREMNDPLITTYFTAYFDMTNIVAFMRIRVFGYNKEAFQRAYVKGGSIGKKTFSDAFDLSNDNVFSAIVKADYTAALAPAFAEYQKTQSLYMMEKARDDYLFELLKKSKHDMFGIAPIMCYYIAKQREAAAVRMVMTSKQGGIDTSVVQKRLKELF